MGGFLCPCSKNASGILASDVVLVAATAPSVATARFSLQPGRGR